MGIVHALIDSRSLSHGSTFRLTHVKIQESHLQGSRDPIGE